jgi:hypothetical protein
MTSVDAPADEGARAPSRSTPARRLASRIGLWGPALLASACAAGTPAVGPAVGAYADAPVTDPQVVAAARFAVAAAREAQTARGGPPDTLERVAVVRAQRQVVAGINYRLSLRVGREGAERSATAEVWWQAWRTPDPYRLTRWRWD